MNHPQNRVLVLDQNEKPLMPCKPRTCRLLLRDHQAKVVSFKPFTIQLLAPSHHYTQKVQVGVDSGQRHIGLAITQNTKVLWQGEVELRQDVSKLLTTRKEYRRDRRNRKTRYRKSRFNRKRHGKQALDVWLPPSVRSKCEHNINWINRILQKLPATDLTIEVGKFDIQKMKDPSINGLGYQQGDLYGYQNVKQYVLDRDHYTCQICGNKNAGDQPKFHIHHIIYRSLGGSNTVSNLLTVCTNCHTTQNHAEGGKLYQLMKERKQIAGSYKGATFMNILRQRLFHAFPQAHFTYGYITTIHRNGLNLAKSHFNDAVTISGIQHITEQPNTVIMIQQFRLKKRSLHEATARKGLKHKNTTSKRNAKNTKQANGWYLNDYVQLADGRKGYLTSFSGKYTGRVTNLAGVKYHLSGKSHNLLALSKLSLLHHTGNWRFEIMKLANYQMH